MAYKLALSDEFKWPIKHSVPVDGGKFAQVMFTAVFKRLSQDQLLALAKEADAQGDTAAESMVNAILLDVADIVDADGMPVDRETVLSISGMTATVLSTYRDAISGTARKN